jgi:hypothetical protein
MHVFVFSTDTFSLGRSAKIDGLNAERCHLEWSDRLVSGPTQHILQRTRCKRAGPTRMRQVRPDEADWTS